MEFRIEPVVMDEFREIAQVIETVWEGLERKEWFAADDEEYVFRMMSTGQGIGFKAVEAVSGCMAGVFMAVVPGMEPDNLGRDIGLGDQELPYVVHMDTVAILPAYRGNRLQFRLMQAAEEEIRSRGYRYLMCTVHPDNRYSRDNILAQGYRVAAAKEKYGGYPRDILLKELDA